MATIQYKFLIIFIMITLCRNVYSIEDFTGIWKCDEHSSHHTMNSYLAITKVGMDSYFVLYVNPYNNHQHDYATYGELDEDGHIEIKTDNANFYIELREDGFIFHHWSKNDYYPNAYEKVIDKETMEIRNRIPEISPEDFYDFIMSQTETNQ